jgi:hypothetical protein
MTTTVSGRASARSSGAVSRAQATSSIAALPPRRGGEATGAGRGCQPQAACGSRVRPTAARRR